MLQINCLRSVPLINSANVYFIINKGKKKNTITVVAKKIVSWLRFSLIPEPVTNFCKRP